MRSDWQRLADIIAAAAAVLDYARSTPDGAEPDAQTVDAAFYNVVMIGEAVRTLLVGEHRAEDAAIVTAYPEIPWRAWVGMRNLVTHQYHRRDWRIVWRDVEGGEYDRLIAACEAWLEAKRKQASKPPSPCG